MATETDTPFHESFDHGVGALSHVWGYGLDTSVPGQVTLNGVGGILEFPGGRSAGHGYGTYTFNARLDGNQPGPALLLWPGNDRWPGQEIDVAEILHDGRHYGVLHWDGGGWDDYESRFYDGVRGGEFHDYTVVWEPGRITYLVDGVEYGSITRNVPRDYDAGGMNNVIGIMNKNPATSVTVREVSYTPLGGDGSGAASQRTPAPAPQASHHAPAWIEAGTGRDRLELWVSQDYYLGDAQYTVRVDGRQVGGIFTASALRNAGEHDTLVLYGDWGGGPHSVTVTLLNDLWHGTPETDRNLYVTHAEYNGAVSDALGDSWYGGTFTVKAAAAPAPAPYAGQPAPAASEAVDWDALAAAVWANYQATGSWFL